MRRSAGGSSGFAGLCAARTARTSRWTWSWSTSVHGAKGEDRRTGAEPRQRRLPVFEDGKQQTIAHFSRDQNLPLELGMLVDISASQANLIDTEKEAGSAFFRNVIRRKDEAFLLSFGHDTVLVQDFTNSVPKLKPR